MSESDKIYYYLLIKTFCHFLSPSACGWIWTCFLWEMSQLFYHCTTGEQSGKNLHCHYSLPGNTYHHWSAGSSQHRWEQQLQSDGRKLCPLQGHDREERSHGTCGNRRRWTDSTYGRHSRRNLCSHSGQISRLLNVQSFGKSCCQISQIILTKWWNFRGYLMGT